jgi:integrase
MAYAEKRGRRWRVKYKCPDDREASRSGFETKASALNWGRDQEAAARAGRWVDSGAGKLTVEAWITQWLRLQDVGISTQVKHEYLLRRFIRPRWSSCPLNMLTSAGITEWENALPSREGISRSTAQEARSLFCTILGDAAASQPPLIPYNPALRPRNRGRRTGRRIDRSPPRKWATPLQTLLIAERAALLSGTSDDFLLIITIAYTGLRWAEAIGLERACMHPHHINVEWQLREIGGTFHRLPPKDDSYRSTDWEPLIPVDLPPFLADLLAAHLASHPPHHCACAAEHGGSGRYAFISRNGAHERRSNYARRVFRPAADGRYPPQRERPGKLVIVDAAIWPGRPLARWPPLQPGTSFRPPKGRGIQQIDTQASLAAWLPIQPGLTPHGLRHSLKTWMTEDGIPEILQARRLGHQVPGMRGIYTHVTAPMREDLQAALQARWEHSLRARAALAPHSPVKLLDRLLEPLQHQALPGRAGGLMKGALSEVLDSLGFEVVPFGLGGAWFVTGCRAG